MTRSWNPGSKHAVPSRRTALGWAGLLGAAAALPAEARDEGEAGSVTLVAGPVGGGELAMAADLSDAVAGDGPRLLVMVGAGGERNLADLAAVRGVDMALVTAADLRKAREAPESPRIVYVAKLHAAELHVLAAPGVRDLTDLDGKEVAMGRPGGSTETVAAPLLAHYGVRAKPVSLGPQEAVARLGAPGGPVAAAFLSGKPAPLYGSVRPGRGLSFLPVPYDEGHDPLLYPAVLEHADYPDLVPEGGRVQTVSVPVALIAFDWAASRARHARLARFTKAMAGRMDRLRGPGCHPKWAAVNLAGAVEGWRRFGTDVAGTARPEAER